MPDHHLRSTLVLSAIHFPAIDSGTLYVRSNLSGLAVGGGGDVRAMLDSDRI
jgi:hypothetical protein